MSRIVALGAEMQAASSLALAYPDRNVLFISDQPVLDGWDIPNVRFQRALPGDCTHVVAADDMVVPLSPRWLDTTHHALTRDLPAAAQAIGSEWVLPVESSPRNTGYSQVKGDRWHRPDAPMAGPAPHLAEVTDTHGCGLVYQPRLNGTANVMAIGRRSDGAIALGLFQVFEERFFRFDVLQAAESMTDARLTELSLAVLAALNAFEFFTLNWLFGAAGPRLTSVRPVPRAAFGAFRRGGIDPLAPEPGVSILRAGLRLVAQPHYSSYRRLER